MKLNKKFLLVAVYIGLLTLVLNDYTFAADPEGKINSAVTKIQGVLTGIVGGVGIIAGIWIVVKKLPGVDDPMTKNEMFKGVGYVLGAVFIALALVWIVPWIVQLAS